MRWQWGQVAHQDISIIYGRVFPPADVADPDRVPGFLGVLGREGPLGFSTPCRSRKAAAPPGSRIDHDQGARPHDRHEPDAGGRSPGSHRDVVTQPGVGPPLDFLQLGGEYTVSGKVGDRALNFTARGAAETFRPRK